MRRASYRAGVRWIAENDEPDSMEPGDVSYFVSSLLLADLFEVEPERVGRDVVRQRKKIAKDKRTRSS
jgi:hypothetical protein